MNKKWWDGFKYKYHIYRKVQTEKSEKKRENLTLTLNHTFIFDLKLSVTVKCHWYRYFLMIFLTMKNKTYIYEWNWLKLECNWHSNSKLFSILFYLRQLLYLHREVFENNVAHMHLTSIDRNVLTYFDSIRYMYRKSYKIWVIIISSQISIFRIKQSNQKSIIQLNIHIC